MLIFKGDKVLVRGGTFDLDPGSAHLLRSSLSMPRPWSNVASWGEVGENWRDEEGDNWLGLRAVWSQWGDEAFIKAGTAYQYMNWLRTVRFCSHCGGALVPEEPERGLRCKTCGSVFYAPLYPAIIVAVERDGRLLLAHNTRMAPSFHSVLAGFVEPGETIEETVQREVMEEVGIKIRDIRYFGSQSWPFPCSLMLGFTAKWSSGELTPDGAEIDRAGWYAPDDMPGLPSAVSISRRLIEDFISRSHK